ncbi:MAG: SH3 domain-containing protein [Phycisphaerae bacterium]
MSPIHLLTVLVFVFTQAEPVAESVAPAQADASSQEQAALTPPPVRAGYVGEVTTDRVYVRSGPSANYYPVTKLQAGDRVWVIGSEGTWLAIEPPSGCHSLVADTYVDTGDGNLGVINGDNVRVRAASLLSEKMYAIQTKLSKGAEVRIVGDNGNGYYLIAPPAGCKLWMAGQYVLRVPDERLALEAAERKKGQKVALKAPDGAASLTDAQAEANPAAKSAEPPGKPSQPKDLRAQVEQIDADLKLEMKKPLLKRELARFLDAFGPLADQDADTFARLYATNRLAQVRDMMERIDAVRSIRELREQVSADRTAALAGRASIRPRTLNLDTGFDIQGQLRRSAVYAAPTGPRRYRLVDPTKTPVRTLGYVEIPPNSDIDAEALLGRKVGVRALDVVLQTGDVDPISIYIAAEIVVLDGADSVQVSAD